MWSTPGVWRLSVDAEDTHVTRKTGFSWVAAGVSVTTPCALWGVTMTQPTSHNLRKYLPPRYSTLALYVRYDIGYRIR